MAVDQELLDKIKALFETCQERGASEAEEATALRLARKLILKHNLDEDQVRASIAEDEAAGDCDVTGFNLGPGTDQHHHWEMVISDHVARLMLCRVIVARDARRNLRLGFVGRPSNAISAKATAAWLIEQGLARLGEAEKFAKPRDAGGFRWVFPDAFNAGIDAFVDERSFLLGFADRIGERIRELLAEDEGEISNALVVHRTAEATTALLQMFGSVETMNSTDVGTHVIDFSSVIKGARQADQTSLEPLGSLT